MVQSLSNLCQVPAERKPMKAPAWQYCCTSVLANLIHIQKCQRYGSIQLTSTCTFVPTICVLVKPTLLQRMSKMIDIR